MRACGDRKKKPQPAGGGANGYRKTSYAQPPSRQPNVPLHELLRLTTSCPYHDGHVMANACIWLRSHGSSQDDPQWEAYANTNLGDAIEYAAEAANTAKNDATRLSPPDRQVGRGA